MLHSQKIHTLLFLFITCFCNNLSAQWWNPLTSTKGTGPVTSKEFDLSSFSKIGLSIAGDVYLTQGSQQKIKVEAQENIINLISQEVHNGTWNIKFTEKNVTNYHNVKIYITIPNINSLSVAGSGSIIGVGKIQTQHIDLSIGGSGAIKLDMHADDVVCSVAGSGETSLSGASNSLETSIAGSGGVDATDFCVKVAEVSVAGSGDCRVHVTDELKASVAGSGNVQYKGGAKVRSSISGSGDVEPMN